MQAGHRDIFGTQVNLDAIHKQVEALSAGHLVTVTDRAFQCLSCSFLKG